jgi:Domain of unknown function (DUF4157)
MQVKVAQPKSQEKVTKVQQPPQPQQSRSVVTSVLNLQRSHGNRYVQRMLNTRDSPESATVPPLVGEVLSASGQPLDQSTRTFMESRFAHDFSRVQVHTDAKAAESAQAVQARAYTVGRDVVFGAGQYAPGTLAGKRLLAHELTHVVQQGQTPIARKLLTLGSENDAHEQQADAVAAAITSNQTPVVISPQTAPGGMIQRQPLPTPPAPRTGINLFDPLNIRGAVAQVIAQGEEPIRRWLEENTNSLLLLSVAGIIRRVRRNVPQASNFADVEIASLATQWAARHNHTIPRITVITEADELGIPPATPQPSLADSDIVAGVRRAFSTLIDGVGIERAHGRFNISVSGTTVELQRGGFVAGGTLGWGGSLGVASSYRGLHFSGELSADRWELKLSYPVESSVPNLSELSHIFQQGETAMRRIVEATASFRNLSDIPNISDRISPHLQPVKDAMEAATGIAQAPPGVSFGVSATGPGMGRSGAATGAEGITVSATLTIRF